MAEFEKMVKSMNKVKEFKEVVEEQEPVSMVEMIPWVDKPRLIWNISVDWDNADIANLQAQIDSLDARVTALENP